MCEVVAWTAVEPHSRAVLPGDNPKAIVLDLVQPLAAGWQFIGFGWKARRDEPGRDGTLQHVETNRIGAGVIATEPDRARECCHCSLANSGTAKIAQPPGTKPRASV